MKIVVTKFFLFVIDIKLICILETDIASCLSVWNSKLGCLVLNSKKTKTDRITCKYQHVFFKLYASYLVYI